MQYMLKIINFFLTLAVQQTHFLCVGMVLNRSQVHQNVPSNRSITSSFSLCYPQHLELVLAQNGNVEDQP